MNRMRVRVEEAGVELVVTLNESQTAAELSEALPIESPPQTWGAEVCFSVPVGRGPEEAQATVGLGAVGYWPPGSAGCLFFGQQPVSPVNPVGTIEGEPSVLEAVRDGQLVRLERARSSARPLAAPQRRGFHAPGQRPSRTRRTVSSTRRSRVSGRFASPIQERYCFLCDGARRPQASRALASTASAAARSSGTAETSSRSSALSHSPRPWPPRRGRGPRAACAPRR